MIVAFVSMKGGVGKSTLAVHAYEYARRNGMSAWLVDMDPQASSSQWLDANDPDSNCYHLTDTVEATKAAQARNADHDWVIIDGGGGLANATKAGMLIADHILIPTKASLIDYTATLEVLRLANQVRAERGREAGSVTVVPSMIMAGQLMTNKLMDELDKLGITIGTPIHHRAAFTKAAGDGNFVWDQHDSNATAEIELLMQSIQDI
jgi:chromosome partitioning protein